MPLRVAYDQWTQFESFPAFLDEVVLRFGIASALLALIVKATGGRLALTRAQHLAALGQGLFSFAISYAFVYASEEKIENTNG